MTHRLQLFDKTCITYVANFKMFINSLVSGGELGWWWVGMVVGWDGGGLGWWWVGMVVGWDGGGLGWW